MDISRIVCILVSNPGLKVFSSILLQDVSFQPVRKVPPYSVIQRRLKFVSIGTEQSLQRIPDNSKLVIVLQSIQGFFLG